MATHPQYNLSEKMLSNIARIHFLIGQLDKATLPRPIVSQLEQTARELTVESAAKLCGAKLSSEAIQDILHHRSAAFDDHAIVENYDQAHTKLLKELNGVTSIPAVTAKQIRLLQRDITYSLLPAKESGHFRTEDLPTMPLPSLPKGYIPPSKNNVPKLIKELCAYVESQREYIDPLLLAGLFHKQFLLIRPFTSGNRRTAMLYTSIILSGLGLKHFPIFSFEHYYFKRTRKYTLLVNEIGTYETAAKADFTPWLEFFTDGIIDELLRVEKSLPQKLKTETVGQFGELIQTIAKLPRLSERPLIIGISGYGGSGKSTLAENLRHHLKSTVISIDHFAMGSLLERDAEWSCYDRERMKKQVLKPAKRGKPIAYEAYDWLEETLGPKTEIPSTSRDIIIIEGVSIFHPNLRPYFDFAIWVDCPLDVAVQRGIKRSRAWGYDHDQKWIEIWMPNERDFFEKYHPNQFVDFLFVTHESLLSESKRADGQKTGLPYGATSMSHLTNSMSK